MGQVLTYSHISEQGRGRRGAVAATRTDTETTDVEATGVKTDVQADVKTDGGESFLAREIANAPLVERGG